MSTTYPNTQPLFISFQGKFGSGKSTTSQNLATKLRKEGKNVYEMHFASFVKRSLAALLGVESQDLFSRNGKEKKYEMFGGETIGRVSQIYANFNIDRFGANFYNILMEKDILKIAERQIKPDGSDASNFVFIFDDARFLADIIYLAGHKNHILVLLAGDPKDIYKNNVERDKNDRCETEHLLYKNYDLYIDTQENDETAVVDIVMQSVEKIYKTNY